MIVLLFSAPRLPVVDDFCIKAVSVMGMFLSLSEGQKCQKYQPTVKGKNCVDNLLIIL